MNEVCDILDASHRFRQKMLKIAVFPTVKLLGLTPDLLSHNRTGDFCMVLIAEPGEMVYNFSHKTLKEWISDG
jgi:hypothetical protein